ncbi:MAG: DUF368 domain-containing protein [Lewinellaceae bacterium]|nr:DUF368 domain-containing protein [Lewinellaceae bacterium]
MGVLLHFIIASAVYIGTQVERWTIAEVIALVAGTLLVLYLITIATPAEGSTALGAVFIAYLIAISSPDPSRHIR